MTARASLGELVARLLASPHVVEKRPPREVPWPIAHREPDDLAELYRACDGVVLDDGVRSFGRGELRDVTDWLVLEKGLSWPDDLIVVGERRDMVIVLDLDVAAARAGGGVLEVGADDLGAFERVASSVVRYLLARARVAEDDSPPPEVAARAAAARGDRLALARELARPMYPGQARMVASLAVELGALAAVAEEREQALSAFERSVAARMASVTSDARAAERAAGWRAAALACRARGCAAFADECERRAGLT